ncbi:LexA family protein [Acinetobacter courvalinii]|uniref:XRE family transcriptional regulator n=1 Tax=Acinetobacter courvalinii TaxID=280147 RepID=A0AA42L9N2_9GAMM|nr:XRE family transcriptional regulator [Acinetobacter courvalinii]MBJ8417114.1 helix-turn-helix transcriptional regulator [Acinetobacter courvalinii]MBJ9958485.1 helix-turn-helix transcriptional regulator [Acinetobacter courvalinii]MCU4641673.1 XRE family transcriptional regulator [Acinetobacter courvalinii]MDH0563304.1 XRE family transcriptional regulator [Acinetobacter courvalinii]
MLKDRLKEARKRAKKSQKDVVAAVGITQSALSQLETGLVSSSSHLPSIAKYLGVDAYWLQTGQGQAEPDPSQPEHAINISPVQAKMAPVLSWVQAGIFTNVQAVDMAQVEEWLPLPDDCDQCFYLKVQGLSNYPVFHEGDYILVDPTVQYSDMQSGDMIVVRKHEDATFKKLVIETDNSRYLQALNPEFKPNIIPLDEECIFVGEVVDSIRYIYQSKRRSKIKHS